MSIMLAAAGTMAASSSVKIDNSPVNTTMSKTYTNGGWVRAHAEWNTSTMWNDVAGGVGKAGSDGSASSGTPTGDVVTAPFSWLVSGTASDLEIQFNHVTGDTPTLDGGTRSLGTWYSAELAFTLVIQADVASGYEGTITKSSAGNWKVRKKGTTTVLATGDYNITANATGAVL
jgi:hypothetical protein